MLNKNNGPKFNFREIVRIIKQDGPVKRDVVGLEGRISGRAQDENGDWSYAVFLYQLDENWMFDEDMLQTMGTFDEHKPTGMSIRIRMEGQRGIVVRPDEESHHPPRE
jgi:hypothetical protein